MRAQVEAARFLAGILLAGYGALILLRLLAHESLIVGAALTLVGVALLATLPRRAVASAPHAPAISTRRRLLVVMMGVAAAGGLLGYNALTRSTLEIPELAILAYGVALIVASRNLDRRLGRMGISTLVAWSIPLVAAPLALYAVDAAIDAQVQVGASPLDWFIAHLLVAPMSSALSIFGLDASSNGQVVALATPRGHLFLSVGVVCAGIQPSILFLGVFGLYAWEEKTSGKRLALLLALGLVGVYLANLARLILLGLVGYHWGGAALQTTHAHAGWALFVGWMLAYWWLVLRRLTGKEAPRAA